MSAYKDAQGQNNISRNVKQYSDLDLFFGQRNIGKDVNKITDIQDIYRMVIDTVGDLLRRYMIYPENVDDIIYEMEELRELLKVSRRSHSDVKKVLFLLVERVVVILLLY